MGFLRNPVHITRTFFVLIATLTGYWVGRGYIPSRGLDASLVAFALAVTFVIIEVSTNIVSSKKILLASAGLVFGLVVAWFIYPTIPPSVFRDEDVALSQVKARIICNLIFGYYGIVLAIKHANRFSFSRLNFIMSSPTDTAKILDTSVIVDGRIKELIASNFLQGNFVVPEFVLEELQKIADSSDPKRRARGRRGLEVLEHIKDVTPRLAIMEKDYPDLKGVDSKLIALAKEINGDLFTNDYNLQKVAHLHKVHVLNINELSSMLKPAVYVGENLPLVISKEGKESHQGVGYLEDGTMVVVEDGRTHIGMEVDVSVTSILQTPAGRMIFARFVEERDAVGGPSGPKAKPPEDSAGRVPAVAIGPEPSRRNPRERL